MALLYLEESNPRLRHRDKLLSESSRPLSPSSPTDSPAEKQKPQITLLLVLCMIFEFCVRWTVNAYDSSYGNYLMHTYGVDSGAYSSACFLSLIPASSSASRARSSVWNSSSSTP